MTGAGSRRAVVLGCAMLAMFMTAVEVTIVATAMPQIVGKLGGFSRYTWVFSAYLLTQAATILVFGKLADLYGRRPVLIAGIVVFLAGSALCGLAWSMPSLIAFRLLQGLGAGSIQPIAITIAGDLFSPDERPRVQGWLGSVWGFAAIVGPLAGGLIVEALSWHWIFWINIPVGLVAIAGLAFFLREDVARRPHRIDYVGVGMLCVAISALLVAVTEGGVGWAWASLPTFALGAVVVATTALYLHRERRAPEPMIDLALWRTRLIASVNASALFAGAVIIGVTTFVPVYVQGVLGRSAVVAGFALTSMSVGWPLASMASGRILRAIDARRTVRLGGVILFVGTLAFVAMPASTGAVSVGAISFVVGVGLGLLYTTFVILIQGSVPWTERGSATASNVFARILGGTLGAAALGAVLNAALVRRFVASSAGPSGLDALRGMFDGDPAALRAAATDRALVDALAYGIAQVFMALVVLAALALAAAWLVPRRPAFADAEGDSLNPPSSAPRRSDTR